MRHYHKTHSFLHMFFWGLAGLAAAILFAAIFAFAVTWLWNWLMPSLFGLPVISYLQALGLLVLARLLVGGWHKGPGHHKPAHAHCFSGRAKETAAGDDFSDFWHAAGRDAYREYLQQKEGRAKES